jgi:hypothetical protein
VACLNTDLDNATLDLSRVHGELEEAHAMIVALEAQLEGRNPPEAQVTAIAVVGGLRLPKVLKNTTNMFPKYNILLQEPSALR